MSAAIIRLSDYRDNKQRKAVALHVRWCIDELEDFGAADVAYARVLSDDDYYAACLVEYRRYMAWEQSLGAAPLVVTLASLVPGGSP